MWDIDLFRCKRTLAKVSRQDGIAAVEFAAVAVLFFIILFGIIETCRAMYMYNTLAEVTRHAARAAANIDFRDQGALDLARKRAVFAEATGLLPFGQPVTHENIRIDYLYLASSGGGQVLQSIPTGSMPSCPARNRLNCMENPGSASCIRAVQARVCQEGQNGDTCTPVNYQSVLSIIPLPLKLPVSRTIVNAETLGYKTGDVPCP